MGLGPGAVTAVGLGRIPGTARRRLLRAVTGIGLGAVTGLGAARPRVPTRHGHSRHDPPVLRPRLGFAAPRGGNGARSGTGLGERPAVIAAGPQGAGPAEGQRAGGGHGALAEGAAVRGAAQSGRRGSVLQQGGREPCLRLPGRAQLPGPAGAVPGLPHGARHRPVRGRVPRLPRGACPGGSRAETSAGGAPAPASGAAGGWEWPAPSQSCSGSLLAEFGIACHLGVLTDLPCIGVAKNLLHVDGLVRDELHKEQVRSLQRSGEAFPLTGTSGKVLGMVLRSHSNSSRPLYVSVGHRVSLGTAVSLVRACCRFRIPEPIRQADIRSREYLRRQPCAPMEGLQAVPASPRSKKEAESED